MDIKAQSVENQEKWLRQRGWHPGKQGIWIDPDTRASYITKVAVERALADCRIDSDMQLKPDAPARKDDTPFPLPKP